jgi:hypothetical protein
MTLIASPSTGLVVAPRASFTSTRTNTPPRATAPSAIAQTTTAQIRIAIANSFQRSLAT